MEDKIDIFYNWLLANFKKIEKYENEEYILFNIYSDLTKLFEIGNNLTDQMDSFLDGFESQGHTPRFILTDDKIYEVGIDTYDPEIEFFTLRIKK